MKPSPVSEAQRWLAQARNDFDAAGLLCRHAHFNLACFQAQQAAEKAVKALYSH